MLSLNQADIEFQKQRNMASNFTDRIFFYCSPQGTPEKSAYQHSVVCLAEGLKSLGKRIYADKDYWQISPEKEEYLLNYSPEITPDDCSIVILNDLWFKYGNSFPKNLFHSQRKYLTVYLELWGGANYSLEPEFRQFDFVFKAHYNCRVEYPFNIHPWAFGLSNRVLQETAFISDFQERKSNLLVNFRVKHPVRETVSQEFIPRLQGLLTVDSSYDNFDTPPVGAYDYLMWQQTGRRHYPNYYKRLRVSSACACFGGQLRRSWPRKPDTEPTLWHRILNRAIRTQKIIKWESWRFWEALSAGCVPFHVDYEKYGATLPVMPENWRHYIGIDLNNMQQAVDRLAEDPEVLAKISAEGRRWAIEHYSPTPTAQRFLETVTV